MQKFVNVIDPKTGLPKLNKAGGPISQLVDMAPNEIAEHEEEQAAVRERAEQERLAQEERSAEEKSLRQQITDLEARLAALEGKGKMS